jgi:hypothetical protein
MLNHLINVRKCVGGLRIKRIGKTVKMGKIEEAGTS